MPGGTQKGPAWLRKNKISSPLGYKERSGFCQYELYAFHKHA